MSPMTGALLEALLSPTTVSDTARLNEDYDRARPYRHVPIPGFFAPDFCRRLTEEFPRTERSSLFVEYGRTIGKATVEDICSISPAYSELDCLLRAEIFLRWLGDITRIEHLLPDPGYLGGGTHENLDGQVLHPHIDFNRHPVTGWYRRLNLLVYLNRDWKPEWGGNITLFEDPRLAGVGEVATYAPEWNFGVLFGTSERSWHGFDRLRLDGAPPGTSRRSISAYYYSEEPPPEIDADHSTVYIPPPVLSGRDEFERSALAEEWEALLRNEQLEQRKLARLVEQLQRQLDVARSAERLPLLGYLEQLGQAEGFYPEGWTAVTMTVRLRTRRPLRGLSVKIYSPAGPDRQLLLSVDGVLAASIGIVANGPTEMLVPVVRESDQELSLTLQVSSAYKDPGDDRELGVVLLGIEAVHDA